MTIQFDVLLILARTLTISAAVFSLSGIVLLFTSYRYKKLKMAKEAGKISCFSDVYIFAPFFALIVTLVSFVLLLASSGAIIYLYIMMAGGGN